MTNVWGKLWGVSVVLLTLANCGGTSRQQMVSGTPRSQKRIRYVLGSSVSQQQLEKQFQLSQELIKEPWIGLDEDKKPLSNTAIVLHPTQNDLRSNYQFNFDLLLGGKALRGKTQLTRGPNGEIDGFINSPGYRQNPVCFGALRGWDFCLQDSTQEYVGSLVRFTPTTSDVGPLLHMTFQRPYGGAQGYQTSELNFLTASKVKN